MKDKKLPEIHSNPPSKEALRKRCACGSFIITEFLWKGGERDGKMVWYCNRCGSSREAAQ